MSGGMIALEGASEPLILLAIPDFFDWLLKYVAQHALLFVFFGTPMTKGREAAGEHVAA